MTTAEKRDTPSANGQPVDLNSSSKKDLAALPGIGFPTMLRASSMLVPLVPRKICSRRS